MRGTLNKPRYPPLSLSEAIGSDGEGAVFTCSIISPRWTTPSWIDWLPNRVKARYIVMMQPTTARNGPAIRNQGQNSRYQGFTILGAAAWAVVIVGIRCV